MKLDKIEGRGAEYLHRDPKSLIYYFRRETKREGAVFRSLRTKDFKVAKEKRDEILRGAAPKKTNSVLLAGELFEEWFEAKKVTASPGTITSISASRAYLAPFLEIMLLEEITSTWWLVEYIKRVRKQTHDKRKFFNDRKWLTAFLHAQVEAGRIKKIPKLENPDGETKAGKVFTDTEVGDLINFAQNKDLRLAILMAVTMGMRRLEIFGLRCDRVDLKKRVIRLRAEDTKIRKARSFAVSEACWLEIKERCAPGSIWVFPSATNKLASLHKDGFKTAWTNLRKITGVSGRFHDLRHTFLTKAFKSAGANPALICHYAGLSLEVAQATYLHFDERDTEAVAGLVAYE